MEINQIFGNCLMAGIEIEFLLSWSLTRKL
jgi:hypothetical protein